MSLGESFSEGSGVTKILLHLENDGTDSSGNGNHCSNNNVIFGINYGRYNNGAYFRPAFNSYLANANCGMGTGNINFSAGITFYVTGTQTRGELFCLGSYSVVNRAIMFGVRAKSGGNDAIYFDYAGSVGSSTNTRVKYNSWNYLYVTKSGNNITIILNGVKETFTKSGLSINTVLYIGFYGNVGTAHFNGYIDEFVLVNRVWTQQEIQKYYTNALGRFSII